MERVRRDQTIKDQRAAGLYLCGTCGMEREKKENRRMGTARGAATDGGFADRSVATIDAEANGGLATQHPGPRPTAGRRGVRALMARRGRRCRLMPRGGVGTCVCVCE